MPLSTPTGPITPVLDTFGYAAGALEAGYQGWFRYTSFAANPAMLATGSPTFRAAGSSTGSETRASVLQGDLYNCEVYASVVTQAGTGENHQLFARAQNVGGASAACYALEMSVQTGPVWSAVLRAYSAGLTPRNLAASSPGNEGAVGATDKFLLRVRDDVDGNPILEGWMSRVPGVWFLMSSGSVKDTNAAKIVTPGPIGFAAHDNVTGGTAPSWDDFGGGEVGIAFVPDVVFI